MLDVDLGSGEYGGYAVVALRGELDIADPAGAADALEAFAGRKPVDHRRPDWAGVH